MTAPGLSLLGRLRMLVPVLAVTLTPFAHAQGTPPVAAIRDGAMHLSFGVRGRTCWSDGITVSTNVSINVSDDDCRCGPGVAHATLSLAGGRVTAFRMKVRKESAPAPEHDGSGTELGRVAAPRAAVFLLDLAGRGGADAEELIAAASIADSAVVWPRLIELARMRALDRDARQAAVFWLSQAAGDAATRGLDSIVADPTGDREVREHAVFALSQRPSEEAVPALIRIARGQADPSIRRKALFWLGQTGDERAVAVFEDILRH
jgi:hypothetical protein